MERDRRLDERYQSQEKALTVALNFEERFREIVQAQNRLAGALVVVGVVVPIVVAFVSSLVVYLLSR